MITIEKYERTRRRSPLSHIWIWTVYRWRYKTSDCDFFGETRTYLGAQRKIRKAIRLDQNTQRAS